MNSNIYDKLSTMTESELKEIIDNSFLYDSGVVEKAEKLLLATKEDPSVEPGTTVSTERKKAPIGIICAICSVVICAFIIIGMYIVDQNNKKVAREYAIERIDKLAEEIYAVDNSYSKEYLLAKDKLEEIKILIDENNIDGLPASKYTKTAVYISDLKTLAELSNFSAEDYSDVEKYLRKADSLIRKMSDEKVLNRLREDILVADMLATAVKKVIWGKAFYAAQKHFQQNYPNCTLLNVSAFTPMTSVPDRYTFIGSSYASELSVFGIDRLANSEEECQDYKWIDTEMLASAVDSINSDGGYAIFVNFYENDGVERLYPLTRTYWWSVGVEVSANLSSGNLTFDITRYVKGEKETSNGLSIEEALNFVMLNPA